MHKCTICGHGNEFRESLTAIGSGSGGAAEKVIFTQIRMLNLLQAQIYVEIRRLCRFINNG